MKRLTLAVVLLVLGVSTASADGSGLPPVKSTKPLKTSVGRLADGSGLPPIKSTKPLKTSVTA